MTPSHATLRAKQRESIDILFARLALQYGRHWMDMWADVPMDAVKAEWAAKLALVQPYQIDAAMENIGKFPPTLPEFKSLCDQFRKVGPPVLAITDNRRDPMPEKVREQIAKLMRKNMMGMIRK